MVESGNFQEEYKRMSPQQLNAELQLLYGYLPTIISGKNPSEFRENLQYLLIREKSELKQILMRRLKSLLSFSPTTKSFRNFVASEYDRIFGIGIDRESPGERGLHRLLDIDVVPDSGGIFDFNRAEELERIAYGEELEIYLIFEPEGLIERVREKTPFEEDLHRWKLEFTQLYGDEP